MFTTAPFQHSIRTPGEKRQSLTSRCPPVFIILGKGQPGVTLSTPARVNELRMQNPRNKSSKPTSKTRLQIAAKVRLRLICDDISDIRYLNRTLDRRAGSHLRTAVGGQSGAGDRSLSPRDRG